MKSDEKGILSMFKLNMTSGMPLVVLGGVNRCVYVCKGRCAAASRMSGRFADVRAWQRKGQPVNSLSSLLTYNFAITYNPLLQNWLGRHPLNKNYQSKN